jgi:hypothetical protein
MCQKYLQNIKFGTNFDLVADNDNGLLKHHLHHLRAAQNTAAKSLAQEQPNNVVSLTGKRKAISTTPVMI